MLNRRHRMDGGITTGLHGVLRHFFVLRKRAFKDCVQRQAVKAKAQKEKRRAGWSLPDQSRAAITISKAVFSVEFQKVGTDLSAKLGIFTKVEAVNQGIIFPKLSHLPLALLGRR
jgi:hypothetical protein